MCIILFYNYKNNKHTNSKVKKVFTTRRHFNVKFGTVFSLTSLAISGEMDDEAMRNEFSIWLSESSDLTGDLTWFIREKTCSNK